MLIQARAVLGEITLSALQQKVYKPHQSDHITLVKMSLPEQMTNKLEKQLGKTPRFGTLPFTVVLIGLELLMDREFSCPCTPGLNAVLISFILLGPALLALTVMMFMRRPCRRKSKNVPEIFLFTLIPPSLWMFLLLFEGEYVACGMAHWEGDYILDEKLQIKWCKPTGTNDTEVKGTELLDLTEKITFYSRLSALALLSVLCISILTAIIYRDCKNRTLEKLDKRDEPTQQTSLSSSEAEVQHPSV